MPINIKSLSLGPLCTNCYVVSDTATTDAIVIDPGSGGHILLDAVQGLHVTHILFTHAHFDHIGGAADLVEATGADVLVHKKEANWLSSPARNLSAWAGAGPVTAPPASHLLHGGECLPLLGCGVQVAHTPGHTPGHVVYILHDTVFTGDLIFCGSVGRTDFPGGDHKALIKSIQQTILTLPDHTNLLPGHGPATTVEEERRSNPFLLD